MKGIPEVNVVAGRNAAFDDTPAAFDMYDPCTRTRIAVHIDCTLQGGACVDQREPVYAARAYRMQPSRCRIGGRVRYPRCAGWGDGFGTTQR
ncbi:MULTISPECIES: hypothetical protein [Paraburkholderia]|jgi:hypothetical protein|uniref:Uncharacterized protein n=1 Tax=Paraburkholderia largidicola TaxID=3014751 RepID=A0A7I8BPV6_9BURK|nr:MULTISPECIES: hypothetical protein [Paraburkholderia]BEU24290.1 hypothetical protein PBP221_44300 [Paraburkholderia sp. 22B1P]GJH38513.1 hypothetical protein CBA19CS91_37170 [Paraburkholderia hospita]CAG9258668.1 conserved hypothetical protein [Paraburkholderia caribensis]BCF90495.1 hypothetical protein PPGU16_35620 [Paraburkholderia sp. PGU16]GJH01718.1 hypothetical protein CBA19C8_14195 [Paraburkholderia terrae]